MFLPCCDLTKAAELQGLEAELDCVAFFVFPSLDLENEFVAAESGNLLSSSPTQTCTSTSTSIRTADLAAVAALAFAQGRHIMKLTRVILNKVQRYATTGTSTVRVDKDRDG